MLKPILFGLGMFVLLAYPAYMIYEQETVLTKGTLYKFPLAPVDPYDAFRGRYLALNYNFNDIKTSEQFNAGDQAFAKIAIDSAGYAYLFDVSHTPPSSPYLSGVAHYQHTKGLVSLGIPESMKRYYLNEKLAPQAEKEVQKLRFNNNDEVDAFAEVKIYKGHSNLVELYLKNTPILEYLESTPK
jgi:hypothetical protein